ncbi:MAG: GNAT family N-acetyltransferase [Candidatus Thorarchaeota archaeon]|jgi:RimJ/RimL family protein N-acetyltransferase
MYEGKLVRLRRLENNDVSSFFPHWNNYLLRQYLPTPLPTSSDDMVKYIESANESFANRKGFTFGIETLDTNKLVGIVNLVNVSWIGHNAEVGILAIFDPEGWGKGYGSDAMLVLLDMAFSVLNLHSVYLWVAGFNDRAIKFYEKLGFVNTGRIREMAYRNGKRFDVVTMDILRSEFTEKYGTLPKSGAV